MRFETCKKCGLSVPLYLIKYVRVNYQGKIMQVAICENCKSRLEKESKNATRINPKSTN